MTRKGFLAFLEVLEISQPKCAPTEVRKDIYETLNLRAQRTPQEFCLVGFYICKYKQYDKV